MFPPHRRIDCSMAIVAIFCFCLLSACRTTQPAYFQPQSHASPHAVSLNPTANSPDTASTRTIPNLSAPEVVRAVPDGPVVVSSTVAMPPQTHSVKQGRFSHRNPDSYALQRLNRQNGSSTIAHVAPLSQLIDRHSLARKTYKPALLALGLALLSYTSLFLTGGSTLLWILSITLPMASTLLGTASLLTINRNKERYRGKGWAMAAIVVGTGALGLALVAVAALSVSKIVWER